MTLPTRRTFGLLLLDLILVAACGSAAKGTIGAVLLRKKHGRVVVQDTPSHLASYKAGIRPGDEILTVDGQDVRRLNDSDLSRVLGGGVGEPVNLTLSREGEILRIELRRSMAEPYRVQ